MNNRFKIEITMRAAMLAKDVLDLVGTSDLKLAKMMMRKIATEVVDLSKWLEALDSDK